ncbi:MAG TPA: CDF family Co(II)/Ni(II) efflux transporter DmeF [Spongiibacteraceae bacterium]|nr:CDF family Co(II)/Ni(II) efflux transporter DmeF [Spongiibacteraceae bacterium]
MHADNLATWAHDHVFDASNPVAERSTRTVMWITAAMMVAEIAAGWWYNSMALLADGWHMSSHAVAIGLSAMAYAAARRYARDPRFAFGTWKIEVLGGFASAIFLLGVVALMIFGSIERFFAPQSIHYQQAMVVAIVGLIVNLVCAKILGATHDHGHAHHDHTQRDPTHSDHGHEHHDHAHHGHKGMHGHDHQHDLNLKSAYMHVVADAATSVLAIVALLGGWLYGWSWLDPVMGIVGAVLVAIWAKGLIVQTSKILLDREMDDPVVAEIREVVETGVGEGETRIADLHVWRVGKKVYACALSVVTHDTALSADAIRKRLAVHEEIVHATIEIHVCPDA